MKTSFVAMLVANFATTLLGQGTVNFVLNSGTLLKAPICGPERANGVSPLLTAKAIGGDINPPSFLIGMQS